MPAVTITQLSRPLARIMLIALLSLVAGAVPQSTATAADAFEQWRFRSGNICVETHGWKLWPAVDVAAQWSAAPDVELVARTSCDSYPATQRIVLRTYDSTEYACAKTDPGVLYASDHTPGGPVTLWLNVSQRWYAQCRATPAQRAHVIAHELGHALGIGHPAAVAGKAACSVMAQWAITRPTPTDLAAVENRYPW